MEEGGYPEWACIVVVQALFFELQLGEAGMKAIRIHTPGGPGQLQLEELPTPEPGEGELLVRLEAIGVNYTDVQLRLGALSGVRRPAHGATSGCH